MKLTVPKDFANEIRDIDGKLYAPVNGVVDIPDDKVSDNVWGYGFTRVAEYAPSKATSKVDLS